MQNRADYRLPIRRGETLRHLNRLRIPGISKIE
ncbi:hypothetical protein UA19_04559 [Burkholderia multivorans]|nr:hypothetical protein NP80_4043 [Burkholderia multivorans ATCC BAA-247]SAJ99955.1 hypothetical protein UA19_04559 [Burkholderia multivorans]SAK25720.1 hypothetical protein UA21_04549 [Burkholderia multivorans]SPV02013.1 Uncharacterised protein [Burkholderia multivorans]